MSFEWRTDEDDGWQEEASSGETTALRRWPWRFGLLVLLGLIAAWAVVQWQINQRVIAATGEVETELLATHNFVLQTAVSRDDDLFKANLSARSPDWGEVQKSLLNEGLLLDRPMLGWQYEPHLPLDAADVTLELSPDLRAAELIYLQAYVIQKPSGVTETVTLQQTAVYRLGSTRWLYAPPYEEFWGNWVTNSGEHLTLVYPTRDAGLAEQLAVDLDALLAQMCAELDGLNCGSRLRVHFRLDTDPESLLTSNEIETILSGGLRLNLPTPTLVGLPIDEAGYQALYQAYGIQLATAVLAHQIEYDCCRHQLFFRALRDYQLATLGLQVWPIDDAAYSQMLTSGFDGDVGRHWTRRWHQLPLQPLQVHQQEAPEPLFQQVYMLIEYLAAQETAVSPIQMMRLMERSSYEDWLAEVLPGEYEENLFAAHFLEYIYQQTVVAQQSDPPLPLPSGTITMICSQFGQAKGVFQYDLASGEWREHLRFSSSDSESTNIHSMDGERFLVSDHQFTPQTSDTTISLITPDEEIVLEEMQGSGQPDYFLNYWFMDIDGDFFVRALYEGRGVSNLTLRATDCPADTCPELPLPGWPNLSPDKQHVLAMAFPEDGSGVIVRAELQAEIFVGAVLSSELELVGQGGYSFWLDNTTYGFWQMEDEGLALVTAALPHNELHVLLTEDRLLEEIPAANRPSLLLPGRVLANPQNPQELLLQVVSESNGASNQSYLFKLSLAPDLASVLSLEMLPHGPATIDTIGYSPNGRYFILIDFPSNGSGTAFFLLDQETGQLSGPFHSRSFSLPWSADEQWFVLDSGNYLSLQAPAHDYQYFIPHGLGNCQQVLLSEDE